MKIVFNDGVLRFMTYAFSTENVEGKRLFDLPRRACLLGGKSWKTRVKTDYAE